MAEEMVNELTRLAPYSEINCGYPSLLELKWKEMAKEDLQKNIYQERYICCCLSIFSCRVLHGIYDSKSSSFSKLGLDMSCRSE